MPKVILPPSEGLYPVPVTLVTCLDKSNNRCNIITIAWCGVASSKPPQLYVSIRPSRHTFNLIKKIGDFVVNVPDEALIKSADMCGVSSGLDMDKFTKYNLTELPSQKISSPGIKECPVNIECKLKKTIDLGAHHMFIGEVVSITADRKIIDKNGRIDFAKARPFVYNQGEYWNLGRKIGYYGFSKLEI